MRADVASPFLSAVVPTRAAAAEIDEGTLAGCRARDEAALRRFVARYERPVFAYLSRTLGAGPHVEDLAQEVFVRATRALAGFDPDGTARPSTWLLTIASRVARDARRRRRLPAVPLDEEVEAAGAATPESESERRELGGALARAAASLPDDQREAFALAEFHGLTMAEIAAVAGVPEATAKTRLFRARERLRAMLGPWWTERTR